MLMAFQDEHILWLACTVYFLAIAHTRFPFFWRDLRIIFIYEISWPLDFDIPILQPVDLGIDR